MSGGPHARSRPCTGCRGEGYGIDGRLCTMCHGEGRIALPGATLRRGPPPDPPVRRDVDEDRFELFGAGGRLS